MIRRIPDVPNAAGRQGIARSRARSALGLTRPRVSTYRIDLACQKMSQPAQVPPERVGGDISNDKPRTVAGAGPQLEVRDPSYPSPSGEQFEIRRGTQRAVVTEVGASLRLYAPDGPA